jgi:hypothetical protein
MLQDDRVKWIRQRVAVALEIPTESIDAHFSQCSFHVISGLRKSRSKTK